MSKKPLLSTKVSNFKTHSVNIFKYNILKQLGTFNLFKAFNGIILIVIGNIFSVLFKILSCSKLYGDKSKDVHYYGFDLFEDSNKSIIKRERSKTASRINDILKLLSKHAKVFLFKGFTKQTLKRFAKKNKARVDFAFIDGGHKVETIASDYYYCKRICKKKSIIVFDDFYSLNQPNTKKFGSNKIFFKLKDRQKIKLLPLEDKYTKNKQKINIKMFLVKNHS